MIIAVKIFGAAEGLRPSEMMLANALAAKTALGPRIHMMNIMVSAELRSMLLSATPPFFLLFDYRGHHIPVDFHYTPFDGELTAFDLDNTFQQTTQ